jgi:uncharacterized membrane protein YgdD (TMEM256/DUF423 family)
MAGDRRIWLRLAAASGFISVVAGAFGAHGATDPAAKDLLRTGAQYQAIHALAVLAWAALVRGEGAASSWAPRLFLAGTVLFSGSLYALALGAPRLTGLVTPLGGLMFLAGWAALAWGSGLAAGGVDRHSR